MEGSILGIAVGLASIPYQLMQNFIWTLLDFMAFDLLQLGSILPISF